jgi:hypothetical protein
MWVAKLMTCQNLKNKLLNITVLFIWYLLASLKKTSLAKHGELFFILASNSFSPLAILLGFRRNFLSVLHPNIVSSPIKGILEILNLTPRCIPMDILAWTDYKHVQGWTPFFIPALFKSCLFFKFLLIYSKPCLVQLPRPYSFQKIS